MPLFTHAPSRLDLAVFVPASVARVRHHNDLPEEGNVRDEHARLGVRVAGGARPRKCHDLLGSGVLSHDFSDLVFVAPGDGGAGSDDPSRVWAVVGVVRADLGREAAIARGFLPLITPLSTLFLNFQPHGNALVPRSLVVIDSQARVLGGILVVALDVAVAARIVHGDGELLGSGGARIELCAKVVNLLRDLWVLFPALLLVLLEVPRRAGEDPLDRRQLSLVGGREEAKREQSRERAESGQSIE